MKTEPMLFQCEERESGGVQCEALVTHQGQEHDHWISDTTIRRYQRGCAYEYEPTLKEVWEQGLPI